MNDDILSYIKQLERRISILEKYPSGIVDTWHSLSYSNGWVEYGTGWPARYTKIGDVVYIKGLIKSGTYTDSTVMFTLPIGYRPSSLHHISCEGSGGDTWIMRINSNGEVQCLSLTQNTWASIAVSFTIR